MFREGASSRKGESLRPAGAVVTKGTEPRAGRGLREGIPPKPGPPRAGHRRCPRPEPPEGGASLGDTGRGRGPPARG